jgi:molybdopterin-guanine dinucleotide biosynthesis protein A
MQIESPDCPRAGASIASSHGAVTGAILAGGQSARMGINKGLLRLGGQRFVERLLQTLRPLCGEIAVVANDPASYADLGVEAWPDRLPGKGPLGGIHTALSRSRFPHTFCIACDMPLASPGVIAYLCREAPAWDAVVPRLRGGFEPLHAVYGRQVLPRIEAMLREDRLKVNGLFEVVRVRVVTEAELLFLDPALVGFTNINTPEDLARAAALGQVGG